MSMTLDERLNAILPRITSEDFLHSKGLGNEIGFWVFDYPPEDELAVRAFVLEVVEPALKRRTPAIRSHTVNLFDTIVGLLRTRDLLDKAVAMQHTKGDEALHTSLRSVLKEDRLAQRLIDAVDLSETDLLMVTGVGASYPLLRTHTLLNALHAKMGAVPLLLFFPGHYDGFTLRLFSRLPDDHYYRAFRLVD
ncbi:MAG: hypothetical protein RL223_4231 [Pseudomonadota bacterium]|jgi:hypothetical protein